jgi:hypothetical protein
MKTQPGSKPATVNICGVKLPEPLREPLEPSKEYWVSGASLCHREDDSEGSKWRAEKLVHRTEEDALAWQEFVFKLALGESCDE